MTDVPAKEPRLSQSELDGQLTQATQAFNVKSQAVEQSGHAVVVSTKVGEQFEFGFEETTNQVFVGRAPDCEIQAKDTHVSKKHLRIYRDEHFHYFIEELSPFGAFINDQYTRQGEHRALKHGDAITITSQLSPNVVPFASFIFRVTGRIEDGAGSAAHRETGPMEDDPKAQELRHMVSDDWVRRNWDVSQELGSGAFSTVKLGVRTKQGSSEALPAGLKCAMKMIDKRKFLSFQSNRSSGLTLNDEANLMTSLQHPNIVSCLEWFQTEIHIYLALELVRGGDLLHNLMEGGCLTEMQAVRIFRQICDAVHYIHVTVKLVHRDLKPENVLLTNKDRDTMVPKLADFGLARVNMKSMDCKTFCGTPQYFAPEVINSAKDSNLGYGKPVDMWSLGVNLYIMLCGVPPFEDEGLYQQIVQGNWQFDVPQFSQVSEEAKDLVRKLMTVNPRERINIQQALNEPWLRIAEIADFATPARSAARSSAGLGVGCDNIQVRHADCIEEPAPKRRKSEDIGMVIS